MPLNLVTDPWIPAVRRGEPVTIRPNEIASQGIERLDWPRDDLNLACMELLVGLIYLADPPVDDSDWESRYKLPDPDRLRDALNAYKDFFELTGDGPRFLQDLEAFETDAKRSSIKPPEMLFIDSAGEQTAKNNADLMVRRNRYGALPLPLAAMALYTLQAFAPSGGSGNRTSMRGGGPMVTLMKPIDGGSHPLWRFAWSNVPEGLAVGTERASKALPWLRPTRTSERKEVVTPDLSHGAEAFFGMPRRLRLVFDGERMTGVVQRRYGANYSGWEHPLSPYYCQEVGGERLPVHPKPGKLSYRNWLGLAFGKSGETRSVAKTVRRYHNLLDAPHAELCVGGWAMSNMKPLDFGVHTYPTFRTDEAIDLRVGALVEAANEAAKELLGALKRSVGLQGRQAQDVREAFFANTEAGFIDSVQSIVAEHSEEIAEVWLSALRNAALSLFDRDTISGLPSRDVSGIEAAVLARRTLMGVFTKATGIRDTLELPPVSDEKPI